MKIEGHSIGPGPSENATSLFPDARSVCRLSSGCEFGLYGGEVLLKARVGLEIAHDGLRENASRVDVGRVMFGELDAMPANAASNSEDLRPFFREQIRQDQRADHPGRRMRAGVTVRAFRTSHYQTRVNHVRSFAPEKLLCRTLDR